MQLASTGSHSEGRPAGRPVSRQVLADHVYEELLASLMDGRLEPGTAVSIDGTVRFGVNRAKVHCFAGDTGVSLAYA